MTDHGGRALRKLTIMAGLLGATLLAACGSNEVVLPGERLGIREVLQNRGTEEGTPANTQRAINLPAQVANAAWAQSGVSPFARTENAALGASLTPLWSVNIGQGDQRRHKLNTNQVALGGRIFTMDSANLVTAVSTDGQVLWTHNLTPLRDASNQAQGGGFAAADGRLYVASGFGTLSALDAATGAEIWVQRLDSAATGAPTYRDGLIYLTSGDSLAWAVEAQDGRIRWQIEGVGDINNVAGAPAPAVDDQRVVFAYGDGTVQAAFRQGGLQLWNANIAGGRDGSAIALIDDVTGDPLISGDTVFAGNFSGRTVALDKASGERLWTAKQGALGPMWPAGDSVFFVSDRNQLVRLDARDGTQIWAVDLPGYLARSNPQKKRDRTFANLGPILAGGRLIVASTDGQIRSFDPTSGALVGTTAIDGGATTRPIVVNGVLYVVSGKGQLHAFR
ncbi:Outer membrane protein assembly factor BamB, contains PQQ-like beta-propeller repeat [Puniceibacterium sediminis]|uniref:Outer membrane protein assembly factor BamB, contains PQQ-like beta-propeller repeat n=1 Tax=Puniceibacterium sediminis TaxID=1608407 RepID=A0A238UYZ4_9RHOB|nr:Outer membrane protein assembly factor BamB, contains PQQ-like beta-propeller repeat [Puniceibacterium sediminis]